jgi:hypothetical protein
MPLVCRASGKAAGGDNAPKRIAPEIPTQQADNTRQAWPLAGNRRKEIHNTLAETHW